MRQTLAMMALVLAASLAIAPGAWALEPTPTAQEGDDDEGCNNYGVVIQYTVIGDNDAFNCMIQDCNRGPEGTGAVGVGVGTTAGDGEAGAEASAGTECNQSSNSTESPERESLPDASPPAALYDPPPSTDGPEAPDVPGQDCSGHDLVCKALAQLPQRPEDVQ